MSIRKAALTGLGLLAAIAFIIVSIRHMDWVLVYRELSSVALFPWFFLGITIYLGGHIARGFRTKMLVSRDAHLSLLTASSIVIAGYAANNIIPARAGELIRAGMLSERTGIPASQSLTVVCIERILDGMSILLLCTMAVVMTGGLAQPFNGIVPLIFCAAFIFLLFVTYAPQRFIAFISKTANTVAPRSHDAVLRHATAVVNGTVYISQPKQLCTMGSASILIWLCDAGLFICIMQIFNITLDFWQVLLIMTIANMGVFIVMSPGYASPGYIGTFHILVMQNIMALGYSHSIAFACAITLLCAIYIPIMFWGGAVVLWYGISLGMKLSLARKARPLEKSLTHIPETKVIGKQSFSALDEHATSFIYKLTEAALPLNQYVLSNPDAVISYCANFIQGEIRNLSKKIQLLFFIGMLGFGTLVCCRYLKLFPSLPLPVRIRIFNWWAYGTIPLTRQLFKLIRSTALLAFFEHPTVVRSLENKVGGKN